MKKNNTAKIILIVLVIISIGLLLYKCKDGYRKASNDAEKHRGRSRQKFKYPAGRAWIGPI